MAHFRQQLGTIMEILTKAAVAEIIKLVDDGSAVLRLEMCRTQNENEALKTKIHQMENELGTAMGRRDKARTQEMYVNTRSVGVQVFEEFKEEKQSRIFGEELCISAWRQPRQTGLNKDTLLQCLPATDNLVDVEEERSEPYNFIKQEMYEDTWWSSDPEGELEAGREEMSLQEHHCPEDTTQTMPLKEPTVLSEQHKVGPSEQDLGTREFPIKAEHWKGCALQKVCQPEYEPRTGRGSCLSTEFSADEKGGQPWISFTPDGSTGAGESPERQPILSAQGALSLIPTAVNSCISAPPSSAAGMRVRVSSFESGPEGADLGTPPGCNVKPAPQSRQNPCGFRADATPLSRLQQFGQSINVMAARGDAGGLAFDAPNGYGHALGVAGFGAAKAMRGSRKPCADDKQFRCAHCGRGFSRLTCLKIHQRSHTGEKPYSCVECGRRFTQQKSLKTHQSVHTGERPFSCSLCGKRFSRQDNCTRHERFHSGKKPFSCKQCGKCFTLQSNLKTHQQIHCGFNRLVCAQ